VDPRRCWRTRLRTAAANHAARGRSLRGSFSSAARHASCATSSARCKSLGRRLRARRRTPPAWASRSSGSKGPRGGVMASTVPLPRAARRIQLSGGRRPYSARNAASCSSQVPPPSGADAE
jgi:hypothetical protein